MVEFAAPNCGCTDTLRGLCNVTLELYSYLVMVDPGERRVVTGRDAQPPVQDLATAALCSGRAE